jgi:hypothetical protein
MVRSRALLAISALLCATACANGADGGKRIDPCDHLRAVAYELSEDKSPAATVAVAEHITQHPQCWDAALVAEAHKHLVQIRQDEQRREAVDLWLARNGLGYPQD